MPEQKLQHVIQSIKGIEVFRYFRDVTYTKTNRRIRYKFVLRTNSYAVDEHRFCGRDGHTRFVNHFYATMAPRMHRKIATALKKGGFVFDRLDVYPHEIVVVQNEPIEIVSKKRK